MSNGCDVCSGYGYTEVISLSWTESDFEEYTCKHCNQEQENDIELEE